MESEKSVENSREIYVAIATHLDIDLLHSEIYVPVGLGNLRLQSGDTDGAMGTKLNWFLSEMSVLDRLFEESKRSRYIGLMHYRRYLTYKTSIFKSSQELVLLCLARFAAVILPNIRYSSDVNLKRDYKLGEIQDILTEESVKLRSDLHDEVVLVPVKKRYSASRNRDRLGGVIGMFTLNLVNEIIQNKSDKFNKYWLRTQNEYTIRPANIFAMPSEYFKIYYEITKPILIEFYEVTTLKGQNRSRHLWRLGGYLQEHLSNAFYSFIEEEYGAQLKELWMVEVDIDPGHLSTDRLSKLENLKSILKGEK
jgi:hypothetical protein